MVRRTDPEAKGTTYREMTVNLHLALETLVSTGDSPLPNPRCPPILLPRPNTDSLVLRLLPTPLGKKKCADRQENVESVSRPANLCTACPTHYCTVVHISPF